MSLRVGRGAAARGLFRPRLGLVVLGLLLLVASAACAPSDGGSPTVHPPTSSVTTSRAVNAPTDGASAGPRKQRTRHLRPRGPVSQGWTVTRVVDGDTVVVSRGVRERTLRLIGIDTPETVAPGEAVKCYGPEASAFAQRQLAGSHVTLEFDRSQGRLDRYGRTLAYLWQNRPGPDGLFNWRAVRAGFAQEYTYDTAYAWQRLFQRAERAARSDDRGLWAADTCNGNIDKPDQKLTITSPGKGGCASGYRPCLPIRRDLDCADVNGPVRVTGQDQYQLDADGDGRACESS